jgi:hypothetical protein
MTSFQKCFLLALVAVGARAFAAPYVSGEVVVVDDPAGAATDLTANLGDMGLTLCSFASRGALSFLPDDYDAIVSFSTDPMNGPQYTLQAQTPEGNPVRQTEHGVAYGSFLLRLPPSSYGSAATLKHCIYMGPTRLLPATPDAPFMLAAGPFGVSGTYDSGGTGIEVLGHEFGHHWLVWAGSDSGDGTGVQALFRGDARDPDNMQPPVSAANLHYSFYADSHSVMHGNWVTSLGGGDYKLEGGDRRYGLLDMYLMGLRSEAETPPLLALDDGTHRGLAQMPLPKGQSQIVHEMTPVEIPVQDIIRAIGPRVPAYPATQRCFRVAFVMVTQPGHTATPQEIALVDSYRTRWESWFSWATDGRAITDTRLMTTEPCPGTPTDFLPVNGETPQWTRALPPPPAELAPASEMGTPPDENMELTKLKPRCECTAGPGLFVALAVLALRRRRC